MAEISVIVPVYQVEKYIAECIESILAQTFADFELILVDDGSKDNSGKICDKYAEKDSRIKVIHKENGGVANARNDGLSLSRGEYVCFVDSDDIIDPYMLENCLSFIKENGADILRHGHITELWRDGKCVSREEKNAPDFANALSHAEIAEKMELFWQNCSNYVWNYLFKREVIKEIKFPDIKISEDHIFVLKALEVCEKICFLSEKPYRYRMRMGSSANRWERTGLDCQYQMLFECRRFMKSFGIAGERQLELLSEITLNAYSYALYLLCFPECKRGFKEKLLIISEFKGKIELEKYIPYADFKNLSAADKLKRRLICLKTEWMLLLIGPLFMRIVRKANG